MAEKEPTHSLWPMRGGKAPQWTTGIFYPLVVAGLLGVFVTLLGLREDVAVIKVKVESHGKQLERLLTRTTATAHKPPRRWEIPE